MLAARMILLLGIFHTVSGRRICPENCVCQASEKGIRVDCTGIEITSFPDGVPTNVTELRITRANISSLSAGVLSTFTYMTSLTISQSRLFHIQRGAFDNLDYLRYLDLSSNNLSDFDDGVFTGSTPNLTTLYLYDNKLTRVKKSYFENLTYLGKLFLNNNSINNLDDSCFSKLKNLTTLNLSWNNLTSIHGKHLSGLVNLRYFQLTHNVIADVSADTFADSPDIEYLWLSFNRISTLPPRVFSHFSALYYLSLASNAFTEVPAMVWRNRTRLQSLVLNANAFTRIPSDAFVGLTSLMYLVIDHCPFLTTLDDNAFRGLGNLLTLSLEHNEKLSDIRPGSFPRESLVNVTNLYIRNNSIHFIERDVFEQFPSLHTARIEMNPLNCTCALKWMRQAMSETGNKWANEWSSFPHVPTCGYPANLIGYKLTDLFTDDLTCEPPRLEAANENPWVERNGMAVFQVSLSRGVPSTRWWNANTQQWVYPSNDSSRANENIFAMESRGSDSKVLSSLTVLNVSDEQLGNYTLEANNAGGSSYVQFTLAFVPPPQPPSHNEAGSVPEVAAIFLSVLGGFVVGILLIGAYYISKNKGKKPDAEVRTPLLVEDSTTVQPAQQNMQRFDGSYGAI